ncbi:efflux RND transporter periplasmic adaptor subunit [Arenicella xantha]|uniref:RND family efflux transporter MFP subunit n=1 Tax=Arenicella xantha TaxID=644221 RepID=A0A395JSC5_9GAMM|nr:efflux RND transporter periplasmic adaptor subunit [Arenicella xantha]RBP51600.1 RND family efflux transporter MFP subunit [Arenicella xantha]
MKLAKFKSVFIGVGILGGAVAIVMLLSALKPKPEEEESSKAPMVVRTVPAADKQQIVFANFQGEVRAKTNIELVTQVNGKVMWVSNKFIEGGRFEPGEVLLQIDDADYLVALKSAQASVASAQVDLDIEMATAATNAREWEDLQGKPLDQANPLRLNKPQIDRAQARLDAANAELAAARLNYERTKISAPFSGRIMSKTAELGQFLARGASIGRVFATDAMEIRIPMTDVQIDELGLQVGYSAEESGSSGHPAKVSAVFGTEKHEWPGYLRSIDASVDNETRLMYATITVDDPFAARDDQSVPLVPGMFADVELASPRKIAGLEIPRTALRNGNQVYVFENEKLKLKPVKVVYTSNEFVIVANHGQSAINAGDKVITSSVPGAHEGMAVKLPVLSTPLNVEDGEPTPQIADPNTDESDQTDKVETPDASGQSEVADTDAHS